MSTDPDATPRPVASEPGVVVAVDIGGTKTAVALVDRSGRIVARDEASTPGQDGPDAILGTVLRLAHALIAAAPGPVRGVGVGTAGVVDTTTGRIVSSTDTLAGWPGTDVAGALRAGLTAAIGPVPVHVQNDVDAFAAGEVRYGAATGCRSALVLAVGTGVGAAVVLDGHVRRGAHHVAGEIAHAPVAGADHLRCPCGRYGHLEAIGSGVGLHRHFASLGGSAGDGREVAQRAASGDPLAVRAVTDSGAAVGRAIAAAVTVLDPECVVVSGSVAVAGSLWWDAMDAAMRAQLVDVLHDLPLRPGSLGADAPLQGAAASVWDCVEEDA
ncbi:ROK family protein [Microbacterium luticocti]|uniref:ROK family protein n=1 Tax=Microbacterium luticocti TaxID=451764 RepID=UPI0003FEFAD5|nr:ROK family protein [Microbacterium luticocti]